MDQERVYHLCRRSDWEAARRTGTYLGSSDEQRDGFLHFSTAAQIVGSAARHRAGEPDLLLLTVSVSALGPALRWERSRDDQLFPHFYGPLPVDSAIAVDPLPLGTDGRHRFPPLQGS